MLYKDRSFLKSSQGKELGEQTKSKIPRELAMSGFEEGAKALMPMDHGFFESKGSLNKEDKNSPKKDEPRVEPKSEQEKRPSFKFGSTAGLNRVAKERGGSRGIKGLFKKGEWTKLIQAQKKYESQLGQAIDKGTKDPKTLEELAKKCGSLVEMADNYVKDKSDLLESKAQQKEGQKFEQRKTELEEQLKSLRRLKNSETAGQEERQQATLKIPGLQQELSELNVAGPSFADPVSEQRRSTALLMLPRLKVELVQLQSGQLPSKGKNDSTLVGGEGEKIGAGALNAPTLNKFDEGGEESEGVFKRDQGVDVSHHTKSQGLVHTSSHGMTERAVGSSMVDQLLGTNVVAKTDFAIVGGQLGQVMEKATGETVTYREKQFSKKGKPIIDEKTGQQKLGPVKANQKLDFTDPELQRQLYALEWVDFFTGEGDRHGQNLLVRQGKDGTKVTGIDNDMGFTDKDQGVTQGGKDPSKFPQWIDAKLAQRIMANDFTLNNYVKMLEPILPARSLEVAKARFPKVVEHAQKLIKQGKVVNQKGENLLESKDKTMEWGSEEFNKEMLESKDPHDLLPGFWQQQTREKTQKK